MDQDDPRWNVRRFRRLRPGDEVNLCLRPDLSRELTPTVGARVNELLAGGVDRLPVRVVKAPRGAELGAQDAVKVEAPDLTGPGDQTIYVRVAFLELPIVSAAETTSETRARRRMAFATERDERAGQRDRDADDRDLIADSRDRLADERDRAADARDLTADERDHKSNEREGS